MSEHVHEWYLIRKKAGYVVAECGCKEELTSTQIKARLNATECLSAEDAMLVLEFVPGNLKYAKYDDALQAYAAALEEELINE
jgi:hypothetical protein